MKTSAGNQFSGTVASMQAGAVNTEVVIDVGGGLRLADGGDRHARERDGAGARCRLRSDGDLQGVERDRRRGGVGTRRSHPALDGTGHGDFNSFSIDAMSAAHAFVARSSMRR